MKKYLKIYKVLLRINFLNLMTYRANFINNLIASIFWGVSSIASILLLTSKTPVVFGWKREEILILASSYSILVGFFHTFFSRNFDNMSNIIHYGRLDQYLTKPIDSQFLLTTYWVNYPGLFRIIFGLGLNIYLLRLIHYNISIFNILYFIIFLFIGILLLYSVWFIVTTLTIWFTRLSNLVDLLYRLNDVIKYPQEMFKELKFYIFIFFLPLTLVLSIPVKGLLSKIALSDIFLMLFLAVFLFYISRRFWKFALRYYTSASG